MASSRVGTSFRTRRRPYLVFQVFALFLLMNLDLWSSRFRTHHAFLSAPQQDNCALQYKLMNRSEICKGCAPRFASQGMVLASAGRHNGEGRCPMRVQKNAMH